MTIYAHAFWAWYPFRRRRWVRWSVLGAVLPDLPYLLGFAAAFLESGPAVLADLTLWDRLWRAPSVAALHSFVPWTAVLLAVLAARVLRPERAATTTPLLAATGGWGSHVLLDMLTHRSDGYPIFWPLSAYRFPTPVSYWEPAHYGMAFALASDGAIALLLVRLAAQRMRRPTRVRGARATRPRA